MQNVLKQKRLKAVRKNKIKFKIEIANGFWLEGCSNMSQSYLDMTDG